VSEEVEHLTVMVPGAARQLVDQRVDGREDHADGGGT
jgi:hypothetical protein